MQSRELLPALQESYSSVNGVKVNWSIKRTKSPTVIARLEAPARQTEMWKMVNALLADMKIHYGMLLGTNTVTDGNKHIVELLLHPATLSHIGVYVPPLPKLRNRGMFVCSANAVESKVAGETPKPEIEKTSSGCVIL